MRLIFTFFSLFAICTLVHSNTIYRKYREIDIPVVPSEESNNKDNIIIAELKKDQIPVHIEIVEPIVILKDDKPIELARNVDLEPAAVLTANEEEKQNVPVPELVSVAENVLENLKQSEPEAVEQVRSIESDVELKKDELVDAPEPPAKPELVPEATPLVSDVVRNIEVDEKALVAESLPVVAEIQAPSVRNIEAEVPLVEEAALEQVIVPVVVPVENPIILEESVRNLEVVNEMVPEAIRKIEQAEVLVEANAEKQPENLNEIIAKETVRNIKSEIGNIVEPVVVENNKVVAEPKEELRLAVPLAEDKIVELQEKTVDEELVKKDIQLNNIENQSKEEIVLRSVDLVEPKPKSEDKIEQIPKDEKLEEAKQEEKFELKEELKSKDENILRTVAEVLPIQKVDAEKQENVNEKSEEKLLVVNQDETIGSVRQTAEATTPGNVIQQLLQNNPLTNFIQSIRPQSAQQSQSSSEKPAELSAAPTAPTQPPNLIQQIASGIQGSIQGLQANVQGLFNGGNPQAGSGTTRPPFGFITNLFPGQQQQSTQAGAAPPTGGNVPPNPIQGFLGLFNGNRGTTLSPPTSKTTAAPTAESEPALVDDKIDAVKESAEETETSNENYAESEQELYVGEEGDSPALY